MTPGTMNEILAFGCRETPEKIALSDGTRRVSYRVLASTADALARVLAAQGVELEDRVVIVAQKECALVAGILGILKAGAAYVPLDPATPSARMRALVEDTAPTAIVAPASFALQLAEAIRTEKVSNG